MQCLVFNQAIRELFARTFVGLFANYESFVIGRGGGDEAEGRDSVVNFDRASFLSDQPDSFLPFLTAFLETQMFTSFVDAKLLASTQARAVDENIALFDLRIAEARDRAATTTGDSAQPRMSLMQPPSLATELRFDGLFFDRVLSSSKAAGCRGRIAGAHSRLQRAAAIAAAIGAPLVCRLGERDVRRVSRL